MRTITSESALFLVSLLSGSALAGSAPAARMDAHAYLTKMESQILGVTSKAQIKMEIKRPGGDRELEFRSWQRAHKSSVIKILKPAKDRDSGNLRLAYDLWQYLPNIERVIKVPASMMLQSWMGSNFSNDDLVKASSLARDYVSQIDGKEKVGGFNAVRITCVPKPNAPIAWEKVVVWLREGDAVPLKEEFYHEGIQAEKVMEGSEIKTFGRHTLPSKMTMYEPGNPAARTVLTYEKLEFDGSIPENVFTQEFLRKPLSN